MSKKYLIEPIKQPNWSSCWYTAILMLYRWHNTHTGGLRSQVSDLDATVFAPAKQAKSETNLFNRSNVRGFLKENGFTSKEIEMLPEAFAAELDAGHPFGYVAQVHPIYQHTLVIRGVQKHSRDGLYEIFYVDPNGGHERHLEFFAFALQYPPAWGSKAFIVIPSFAADEAETK